jgi:hypothetical protein
MNKNSYGIEFFEINENLNNIKKGKYHYNYKTIDFMLNNKENTKYLLVAFHSLVNKNIDLPVFYKHEMDIDNFSVLSISDKLLEENKDIGCCCYIGVEDLRYDEYYIEIISGIIKLLNLKNEQVIFHGTCCSSHPALYYGSLLNCIIVLFNPMIYLENTFQYKTLKRKYKSNKIKNVADIENIIINNIPIYIYLFSNMSDALTCNHVKKFEEFCKSNLQNKYEINLVEQENSPHFGDLFIQIINN